MTAPIAATPQLYTPDDLAALLTLDFAERGIVAAVEVGEWEPEARPGDPRVIIDYGDGTIGEPVGHYQPGAWWPIPGTTDVARPLLDDAQRMILAIHAPGGAASNGGEGAAVAARRATDQLLRQTMRAIRRALAAPFREPARVKWPTKTRTEAGDYQGWVKGSLAIVDLVLASPVLDDAVAVDTGTLVDFSATVDQGGTVSPPDTNTENVP